MDQAKQAKMIKELSGVMEGLVQLLCRLAAALPDEDELYEELDAVALKIAGLRDSI